MTISRFKLLRLRDDTGVSGTGYVLHGVILPSGRVVIEWREPDQTIGVYDNIDQFIRIHVNSHEASSYVEYY